MLLPLFLSGGFSALWKALLTRLFGERKNPETVEAERGEAIAQKQATDLADRTGESTLDRLSGHHF